ncbi:MAG: helix-turn-helix domain-containing protein [Lachnospiraceae bacterium]|nr:helix-turn-helix domain-containing protein [Lachnospiraceae bacterium]
MSENPAYDSIIKGLKEVLDDSTKENSSLIKHVVTIEKVKIYSANEVKKIRLSTGMSQRVFAGYLGVSGKTVEAWEAGTNHPSGAASRILNMMEIDNNLVQKFPFVSTNYV